MNMVNKSHDDKQPILETESTDEFQKKMNEVNKNGWYPIHEASFKGYLNAVRRFADNSRDKYAQLELETKDENQYTPILCAALESHLDIVKLLYELGANVQATNAFGHTIIDIAGMRQDIKLIYFVLTIKNLDLNTWKILLNGFNSSTEDTSGSLGRTLEKLTTREDVSMWKRNLKCLLENDLIGILCKTLQQPFKETLLSAFFIILNTLEYIEETQSYNYCKIFVQKGGLILLQQFIKIDNAGNLAYDQDLVCLSGKVLERLSHTLNLFSNSFLLANDITASTTQSVVKIIQRFHQPMLVYSFIDFLANISDFSRGTNIQITNVNVLVAALLGAFNNSNDNEYLLRSLIRLVMSLGHESSEIQNQFLKEGLGGHLLNSLKHSLVEIKELSISCVEKIAKSNTYAQKVLVKDGIVPHLLSLLQKFTSTQQKLITANALWSLAGDDPVQRKYMANKMRLQMLIEFLGMKSDDLYFIACDTLSVLFEQPPNVNTLVHDKFLSENGVSPLVRVLTNDKEHIVLAVIRCIQRLCLRKGYNPFREAQNEIKKCEGITFLVAILLHVKHDLIKAEASVALACICFHNQMNMEITSETLDFGYLHIFKLLNNKSKEIQLLASKALSLFGLNNIEQKKEMAKVGGISSSHFDYFLKSKDDFDRCEAAFQLILLAPLVINQDQALSSTQGIQILIDLFTGNGNMRLKIIVAEKLACLGKLKNGVSEAIVAIDGVRLLCDNLYTENEDLQGTCALALSNYCHLNEGRRKLIHRCRYDTNIIDVLKFYNEYPNSKHCLSEQFYDDWKHYKSVGLPPPSPRTINYTIDEKFTKAKLAGFSTQSQVSVKFEDESLQIDEESQPEEQPQNEEKNDVNMDEVQEAKNEE